MSQAARNLAALFGVEAAKIRSNKGMSSHLKTNSRLDSALRDVLDSEGTVNKRLTMIQRELEKETEGSSSYRKIKYERDLLQIQVDRAAQEAKRRTKLLSSIKHTSDVEWEIKKCKENPLHWFRTYCWTTDPRNSEIAIVPLVPFPYQEDMWSWFERMAFIKQGKGVIEKSRTMGMSWVAVAFCVYHWLFSERKNSFSCLFSSRKEQYVDELGNVNTLLEKCRFILRLLPPWMLPEGFSEDWLNLHRLVNDANGAVILGESSNADIGRGARYSFAFFDEFASYPDGGYAAFDSLSQSGKAVIFGSTPKGRYNKFAELRWSGGVEVKTYHWTQHPFYTEEWYELQKEELKSDEAVAQELDINYDASQPGLVFPMWDERYHVITKKEFCELYPEARVGKSGFRIPNDFELCWAQDWGATEKSHAATVWGATPPEGSPLYGCLFVYRAMTDTSASPLKLGRRIMQAENGEQISHRVMSHEAKGERQVYAEEFGMTIKTPVLKRQDGISKISSYLELRNLQTPNPFTPTLQGHPLMFFIVDGERGEDLRVPSGDGDEMMTNLRMQMAQYHYPESEVGKSVDQKVPAKMNDHFPDAIRYMIMHLPDPRPLSPHEKVEKTLPSMLQLTSIQRMSDADKSRAYLSRQLYIKENEDALRPVAMSVPNFKPDALVTRPYVRKTAKKSRWYISNNF